jgi:hypothetical protein
MRKYFFEVTAKRNIGGKMNQVTKAQKTPKEREAFCGGKDLTVQVMANNLIAPSIEVVIDALKKQHNIDVKGTPSINFFKIVRL